MTELFIGLLLLASIVAGVAGFFWTPAWTGGVLLIGLAIFMRIEKDAEKTRAAIASLAAALQKKAEDPAKIAS